MRTFGTSQDANAIAGGILLPTAVSGSALQDPHDHVSGRRDSHRIKQKRR